jgi:putative transposase
MLLLSRIETGRSWFWSKFQNVFRSNARIWADGGYAGQLVNWVKENCQCVLEIVKRSDKRKGFDVLPHRWVVERIFGWFNRYRRLAKDYERSIESSEAMLSIAMIRLMLARLSKKHQTQEHLFQNRKIHSPSAA